MLTRRRLFGQLLTLAAPGIIRTFPADADDDRTDAANAPATSTGSPVGPQASGNFINVDFSDTGTKPRTIVPQLFGGSTATMLDYDFRLCGVTGFQAASKSLHMPLLRFNCASGAKGGNVWRNIFGYDPSKPPNWSVIAPLVHNLNKIVDLGRTTIVMGIGGASPRGDTLGWTTAQFASACTQTARHLRAVPGSDGNTLDSPMHRIIWEIMNEPDIGAAAYSSYFNAAADALHSIDPNYIIAGPAAADDWGLVRGLIASTSSSRLGLTDNHAYLHCYGTDPVPSDLATARATLDPGGTGTRANDYVSALNRDVTGWAAAIPHLLGEYGIECSASFAEKRQTTIIGAMHAASMTMKVAAAANMTVWAGIWEYGTGAPYNIFNADYTINPPGYFLSKAASVMPGTLCAATNMSPNTLECWATKDRSTFGVLIVNPTTRSLNGRVALSNWPVNSTGNATIHTWLLNSASPRGNISTVAVNAGMTAAITLPGLSIAMLYP